MTHVPVEIERTIWSVAESNDPRAVEEFGARYPDFKEALADRIRLVRAIKGARPDRSAPRLNLPTQAPRRHFGRGFGLALVCATCATLAFALVYTIKSPVVAPQETGTSPTNVLVGPPKGSNPKLLQIPDNKQAEAIGGPETGTSPAKVPDKAKPAIPLERTVSIKVEGSSLTSAIKAICGQAGLVCEFAPGFEDQLVEAAYVEITAKQALADLGQNFGFTVLDQGQNRVLVIPALDPNKPPVTLPDGSFSAPDTAPNE